MECLKSKSFRIFESYILSKRSQLPGTERLKNFTAATNIVRRVRTASKLLLTFASIVVL
jgi:hypothetical protein